MVLKHLVGCLTQEVVTQGWSWPPPQSSWCHLYLGQHHRESQGSPSHGSGVRVVGKLGDSAQYPIRIVRAAVMR